uniref:Mitochondrial transcription termination factor n=1 Tax=Kalanchoe fedtschenkoi TaxID=63787 RepID=A0A7N0V3L2_KALFE
MWLRLMRCMLLYSNFKLCNLLLKGRSILSIHQRWNIVAHKHLTSAAGKNESVKEKCTEEIIENPTNAAETFIKWGCTSEDLQLIFKRCPTLVNAGVESLHTKLAVFKDLGFTSSDLVKIINCRPRLLSSCFRSVEERLMFLINFFGSREVLRAAIVRNPSLLMYDLHGTIIPIVTLYERLGVSKEELIQALMTRPTVIPRTSFNNEKMEYIKKLKISQESKMYKYVVTLIGVSRLQTIREKFGNLEKFGFSEDEVLDLFERSPLLLTLSIDKVQRNMTYLLTTLKLPARAVLDYPYLLFINLDTVIRPRTCLAEKLKELGLEPQISGLMLFTALRMKEKRFISAFITCHPEDISNTLMEHYMNAKGVRRVGLSSKRVNHHGFPF